MSAPLYPSLYQVNTRVWLNALSRTLGRTATLDDIPDLELDRFAEMGFDWVWLLSVWQTGEAGKQISRTNADWRREFHETLPDLTDDDIPGSGFAITGYQVHAALGGDAALAKLRTRLAKRGLRLMLDFVPNHTGLDHPWVQDHPEYYVTGTELDLAREPGNYVWIKRGQESVLLAHGRDPFFPGWQDTLQLNYANPATRTAMMQELLRISSQCDGVRCDMAMLVLPEVFERTWGRPSSPFWPEAIRRVREKSPEFCFMAEVYWDLEWTLQQQGFNYAYDKCLYDRLREGQTRPVREHFLAGIEYQRRLARFLENHDEPRAAATFAPEMHQAAAALTFLSPGLRFFHQGQFEGRLKKISPHLCRAPDEPINETLRQFYQQLLTALKRRTLRDGNWRLLECVAAWPGNWTKDCLIAFSWDLADEERILVVVNLAPHESQGYVRLSMSDLDGQCWRLEDQFSSAAYDRDGHELQSGGLYVDLVPWQTHLFVMKPV